MSDYVLEAKVGRRRDDTDEIERKNDEQLQAIISTKAMVEEEINNISADPTMTAHIEKLRSALLEGDSLIVKL